MDIQRVLADRSFSEQANILRQRATLGQKPEPLEALLEDVRRFAAARRREIRLMHLKNGNRPTLSEWQEHRKDLPAAISALLVILERLSEDIRALRPLIEPSLDNVIALAAAETHPLRQLFQDTGIEIGFSRDEVNWLFQELREVEFRPVHHVCAGGFEDIETLLKSISVGELGLFAAGFVRFTGDDETDERIRKLVTRLRSAGLTASIFLVLIIVVAAHVVVAES